MPENLPGSPCSHLTHFSLVCLLSSSSSGLNTSFTSSASDSLAPVSTVDRGSAADTKDVSHPEAAFLATEPELVVVDLDVAKDGRADCCVNLGKDTA